MLQVRNANSASGGSSHGNASGTATNSNGASSGASNPASGTSNHVGSSSSTAAVGSIPQSLDQLLERQWEQGSQFLMEQAQHFDSKSHESLMTFCIQVYLHMVTKFGNVTFCIMLLACATVYLLNCFCLRIFHISLYMLHTVLLLQNKHFICLSLLLFISHF